MLVFIDESGDAGFKIAKGSSPYFVIALIIFNTELEAEETALTIKKLRAKLKKSEKFEFKFNKLSKELRLSFFEELKNQPFTIRAIIFDKKVIYSSHLRTHKGHFYNFALKTVLEHSVDLIKNAKIRLDASGEKAFRQELSTYLRKYLNTSTKQIMKNLRFRDSNNDVLIQLADMVAGSLKRSFEKNYNDSQIYRIYFKKHEQDIWEFK